MYPNAFVPLPAEDDAKALVYLQYLRPASAMAERQAFIQNNKNKSPGGRALVWIGHFYECDLVEKAMGRSRKPDTPCTIWTTKLVSHMHSWKIWTSRS